MDGSARNMGIDIYGSCSVPLLRWTTKRRMEVVQELARFNYGECGRNVLNRFRTLENGFITEVGSKDSRTHWASDNLSLSFFQVEGTVG